MADQYNARNDWSTVKQCTCTCRPILFCKMSVCWRHFCVGDIRRRHLLASVNSLFQLNFDNDGLLISSSIQCQVVAQVLRHFVKNVLEEAHKRSLRTVGLPAVGTGGLNFPADVVARCIFDECDKFSRNHLQSLTTLSEVRLVVYEKDQSTFDVRLTTSVIIRV